MVVISSAVLLAKHFNPAGTYCKLVQLPDALAVGHEEACHLMQSADDGLLSSFRHLPVINILYLLLFPLSNVLFPLYFLYSIKLFHLLSLS